MIIGVGVDLVNVPRMERALKRKSTAGFVRRVFSPEEAEVCRSSANPAECFAARFAAKEAVSKALGTGFSKGIGPRQIQVVGNEFRQPGIKLVGKALKVAVEMKVGPIHVSLTHTAENACAFVVIESAGDPLISSR